MSFPQSTAVQEGTYPNHPTSVLYGQPGGSVRVKSETQSQATPAPTAQNDVAMSSMMNSFSQAQLGQPVPGTAMSMGINPYPVPPNQLFYTADGQLVYLTGFPPNVYAPQALGNAPLPESGFAAYPTAVSLPQQAPYHGYLPSYPVTPYTPARTGYYSDRSDNLHKDVPGLENRRGSYSTNESVPGTPFYGPLGQRDHAPHIAVVDRSPIYSSPSPQQLAAIHHMAKPLPHRATFINLDLDALLQQEPAIPRAVPAVFTPREHIKSLEQSLANPIFGNRNVYIRGLHPETDDDMLAAYAARFGRVETSKAIIDTSTGACKGFGFAKYHDVHDAELAIRGFYKLGYEVGFARESFNSRLKSHGDDTSTNLYVSNLPKDMTESELGAIFMNYVVSSSRILRDDQGKSRGVGFARFETREICEEIIKKFHGQPIGDEGLLLQVRYADTPAQKDLKRVTSERRQFRTTEYNVGAYGGEIPLSPSELYVGAMPRMAQIARHLPTWHRDVSGSTGASSAPTTPFKDIDTKSVKIEKADSPKTADSQTDVNDLNGSENESGDEGVTIQCMSPAVGHDDASSPTSKKP